MDEVYIKGSSKLSSQLYSSLTPGQNLKRLRNDLELRQTQITGQKITRNLISLVENDKTPLHKDLATIVAENMNYHLSEESDLHIFPEDILYPERIEAKKIIDEKIVELKERMESDHPFVSDWELNELEAFFNHWQLLDKKAQVFKILAKLYFYNGNYNKEFLFLLKAFDNYSLYLKSLEDVKISEIMCDLTANCIAQERYQEAVRMCDFALTATGEMSSFYQVKLIYNKALSYFELCEYPNSLEEIDKAFGLLDNTQIEPQVRFLVLKGNCYKDKNDKEEAVKFFYKALCFLKNTDKYDFIAAVCLNLLELYIKTNNKEGVLNLKDKVLDILPNVTSRTISLAEIYIYLAGAYYYLKEYPNSELYYIKAYYYSKENKDTKLMLDASRGLLSIYPEVKSSNCVSIPWKNFCQELESINIDKETALGLDLLRHFLDHNDIYTAKQVVSQLLSSERGGSK